MKNTLAVIALCLLSGLSFGQAKFGIKVAGNMSNIHMSPSFPGVELKAQYLPQGGLVFYSDLSKPLFIQSGLLFNQKGTSLTDGSDDIKLTYSFLELPVNVGFQIPISESFKIAPYVGGYAGYALMGKLKIAGMTFDLFDDELTEESITTDERLDYGANAGLGLHIGKRVIVSGQYSHGLKNLAEGDEKVQTRTISAGLTFLF
jgi:hypothetical protein